MEYIINLFNEQSIVAKIIICLLLVVIYTWFCVSINKLHNAKRGKTTIISWIPVLNIYLLGELTIHLIVGLLLVIGLFFGICISFNIPNFESIHNLISSEYVVVYQIVYALIILILFIISKLKLNRIIQMGTSRSEIHQYLNKDFTKANDEPKVVIDNVVENNKPNYNDLSPLQRLNNHIDNDSNNENK